MKRRYVGFAAVVVVFQLAQLLFVLPSNADSFGTCGPASPCIPDSYEHTFCYGSSLDGQSNMKDAIQYAMGNMDDQTYYYKNFVSSCGSTTDVKWTDGNLGVHVYGNWTCDLGLNGDGYCEGGTATVNITRLDGELNKQKTSCHELGHSLGAMHDDNAADCMKNGPVEVGHKTYSNHHIDHINSRTPHA